MRYRIDPRRTTFSDLRQEASFPLAILYWLITRLPIKIPCSLDVPTVDSLQPYLISKNDVSADIKSIFQSPAEQLTAQGFRGTLYHRVDDPDHHTTIHYASFVHKSGQVIARLRYRVFRATTPHKIYNDLQLISRLEDNTFVVSSSAIGEPDRIETIVAENRPQASLAELWATHLELLKGPNVRSRPTKVRDGQHLLDIEDDLHKRRCQHLVDKRLFVETDDADLHDDSESGESFEAAEEAVGAEAPDPDAAPLLTQIRKLENKPAASWNSLILTLAVSAGFFIAAGGFVWDWKFTLLLVPILLFHELGHFLSMKLFDYRNVQMFFIPLFGAAVTGRHYNVPGWKKIITSLMGPVPGILLGTALGIVAIVNGYESLLDASLLMIALNAFNLLPSLPLDGGWVMHGLVFSRHAFLDVLFRLLAIGLAFFLFAVGAGNLFLFLAIVLLIALPTTYHTARISDRLRAAGGFPDKAIDGHIPADAANKISAELNQAFPKGLDIRAKAKLVLQIFETVNCTPPGWLASLCLGGVYAASLVTAVVAASFLYLGKHSDLQQLLVDAAFGPQRSLVVSEMRRVPADATITDFGADEVLVLDFPERARAEAALEQLRTELPDGGKLLLVGSTVMVPLDSDEIAQRKDEWFDRFEADDTQAFLCSSERTGSVSIQFVAPSFEIAEQIDVKLSGYFALTNAHEYVPPWHTEIELTSEQTRARETVRQLIDQEWMADEDLEIDFYDDFLQAQRRGQKDKVKVLHAKMLEEQNRRLKEHLDSLRKLPPDEIDREIVDAYEADQKRQNEQPPPEGDELDPAMVEPLVNQWLTDFDERLGKLAPALNDNRAADPTVAHYGYSSANGMSVNLNVTFDSLPVGLLTLLDWLDKQQCIDLKYSIHGGF